MELTTKSKIQLLPEHIIDQIKAGEVIERPSTLLKEIIENSIDAKATEIELHIINNGLDLIMIKDNGQGINADDLPLAFCRHATSKINRFEDIYGLHSYGFRGEALASIASISRITCDTQTAKARGLIKIEGGQTLLHDEQETQSEQTGTKIFIKDLFYNTPVRMKFIQSKTSEKNQIKKILNAFLLTHPQVAFSIKWDEEEKHYYKAQTSLEARSKDVLFKNKEVNFVNAEARYDGTSFKVLLTKESSRGNAHKTHYLFINNRFVQDIQIHKIILNTASSLWPEGETGSYIAYLDIPADEIDVNIHPNKTVVKLFQAPKIMATVSGAIRHTLNGIQQKERRPMGEQTELQAPLTPSMGETSRLDYKQIDMSSEEAIDSYFENLHKKTALSNEVAHQSIQVIGDMFFNFVQDIPYLGHAPTLMAFDIQEQIKEISSKSKQVPLLISKPIKLAKKIDPAPLKLLEELNYEVDFLTNDTVVIRAFPEELQSQPYVQLANLILKQNISSLAQIDYSELSFTEYSSKQILNLLEKYSQVKLLEHNIIKPLSEKKLYKLYAKSE